MKNLLRLFNRHRDDFQASVHKIGALGASLIFSRRVPLFSDAGLLEAARRREESVSAPDGLCFFGAGRSSAGASGAVDFLGRDEPFLLVHRPAAVRLFRLRHGRMDPAKPIGLTDVHFRYPVALRLPPKTRLLVKINIAVVLHDLGQVWSHYQQVAQKSSSDICAELSRRSLLPRRVLQRFAFPKNRPLGCGVSRIDLTAGSKNIQLPTSREAAG